MYIEFIENNDNEGELWSFFIPVKENKEAIKELGNKISEAAKDWEYDDFPYELKEVDYSDEVINVLLQNDDNEYMARYAKMDKKLSVDKIKALDVDDLYSTLYKGGIKDLVN